MRTLADLKRRCVPGTRLHIVNHARPEATRDAEVLPKTNTVDLVTSAPTAPNGSHLAWPKARDVRFAGPNVVHIDHEGTPFLTVTFLDSAR